MENSIKNIYEELNNTLNSFSFIDRYHLSKTAFIRNRTLSFPTLTYWHWCALARLVLNQLKSLRHDEVNRQVWTVELPFIDKKQAKSLQIQIAEENKKNSTDTNKSWSATLDLTPPNLSKIHCKISYFNNTIHTNFWSETGETTQLIKGNLDYLSERLKSVGLQPGNLNAQQKKDSTPKFMVPTSHIPKRNQDAELNT
jgi:hypothetical protein